MARPFHVLVPGGKLWERDTATQGSPRGAWTVPRARGRERMQVEQQPGESFEGMLRRFGRTIIKAGILGEGV